MALDILDAIPRSRINDVCYLDAADTRAAGRVQSGDEDRPGTAGARDGRHCLCLQASLGRFVGAAPGAFPVSRVAALISRRHATLIDLPRIYTDDLYRSHVLESVTDPETSRFWFEEFPSYSPSFRSEAVAPILNKAGQIAASPQLRLILGQLDPRLDLSFTMNQRRILVANLAKGTIGEQASNLLGSLLVSHLQLVAMERGARPPHERVPFFVHVDEFQTFSSDAFATLLSEARKFALHFCLVNQFTDQLAHSVRSAVLGNAGTLIAFRVGSRDAQLLAPEFHPMEPSALTDQSPSQHGCADRIPGATGSMRRRDFTRCLETAQPFVDRATSVSDAQETWLRHGCMGTATALEGQL